MHEPEFIRLPHFIDINGHFVDVSEIVYLEKWNQWKEYRNDRTMIALRGGFKFLVHFYKSEYDTLATLLKELAQPPAVIDS